MQCLVFVNNNCHLLILFCMCSDWALYLIEYILWKLNVSSWYTFFSCLENPLLLFSCQCFGKAIYSQRYFSKQCCLSKLKKNWNCVCLKSELDIASEWQLKNDHKLIVKVLYIYIYISSRKLLHLLGSSRLLGLQGRNGAEQPAWALLLLLLLMLFFCCLLLPLEAFHFYSHKISHCRLLAGWAESFPELTISGADF